MLSFNKSSEEEKNEDKIVDQIRALGLDMIYEAGSGHPGIVLGAAPILYTLYAHHLRFDPEHSDFFNRDRFVMSSGHGSALLYATLSMAGFPIALDDLKKFRQLGSITPGHPEYGVTPGVDATTGPLGQGFAMAVGMAMAEKHSESLLNKTEKDLISYRVYCLCGDGDLMEGVSYEAASLAGQYQLNNLIVLYDSNHVSLDSDTSLTFPDNIETRFTAMNWEVITTSDEVGSIDKALEKVKENTKPTLIQVKTTIGKYAKDAGKNTIHGRKLTEEDLTSIKKEMNVRDIPFTVSSEALDEFRGMIQERNQNLYQEWYEKVNRLPEEEQKILDLFLQQEKTIELTTMDYEKPEENMESLREASGKILNSYAKSSPLIIGGAADLASSTMTSLKEEKAFEKESYEGRNILFGVREFAMACIANGFALSGYRPFVSTYLSFSDYLKPALRLSCLMNLPVLYIFTHDSISVGMDGPTHQPVEQLVGLRATPNLDVFRPADTNEVIGAYKAVYQQMKPACIILGRNKVPIMEGTSVPLVAEGAYIVRQEERKLDAILIATGEEVSLGLEVVQLLVEKGYDIRLVSAPSLERYHALEKEKQEELFPVGIKKFVLEKSSSYSWYEFVHNKNYLFTIDCFGASGTKEQLDEKYGFTKEAIADQMEQLLK